MILRPDGLFAKGLALWQKPKGYSADRTVSCDSVWQSFSLLLLVFRPLDYVTKLVSGLLACELPLDGNPVAIHTTIPGPGWLAQASEVSDSAFA